MLLLENFLPFLFFFCFLLLRLFDCVDVYDIDVYAYTLHFCFYTYIGFYVCFHFVISIIFAVFVLLNENGVLSLLQYKWIRCVVMETLNIIFETVCDEINLDETQLQKIFHLGYSYELNWMWNVRFSCLNIVNIHWIEFWVNGIGEAI